MAKMDDFIQVIKDHDGVWGFLALVLTLVGGCWAILRADGLKDQLKDPNNWPGRATMYQNEDGVTAYFAAIRRLVTFSNWAYGFDEKRDRPNPAVFGRCVQIAYLYPLFGALIGWVVFNASQLGTVQLFDPDILASARVFWAVAIIVFWCVFGAALYQLYDDDSKFNRWLVRFSENLTHRAGFHSKAARWVRNTIWFGAGAVAVASASAFAFASAVASAVASAFASAVAVAGAVAVAVVVAVAVAGAVAVAVAFLSGDQDGIILVLFYAVLPFLNAIADMVCLSFTRHFLRRTLDQPHGVGWAITLVLVDIFIAILSVGILLIVLGGTMSLYNLIVPAGAEFDWYAYWINALQNPSQGFALWLMLATTIIPTAIHICMGLGAMVVQRSRWLHDAGAEIATWPARYTAETFPSDEALFMARRIRRAQVFGTAIAALGVVGVPWLLVSLIV